MEEIVGRILEAVKGAVRPECEVRFQEVKKNNGVLRRAVVIREPGMDASPVIYIDSILKMLGNSEISLPDAAAEIAGVYESNRNTGEYQDAAASLSREKILEKVVYQLVNREKNEEKLADMPHKELLDLAAVFRVIVDDDGSGKASFAVSSGLCRAYGISVEDLDDAAWRNTEAGGFCTMALTEILGMQEEGDAESGMFVLTNTAGLNGAVVMLFNSYLDGLAGKLGSDLYILPSSIHEVIAVPVEGMEPDGLKEIVRSINCTQVAEDEVLSDSVYKYSRKGGLMVV